MEKILAPADRVLTEIGRFVLLRPLFSGVLLVSAICMTLFFNSRGDTTKPIEHLEFAATLLVTASTPTTPAPVPAIVAVNNQVTPTLEADEAEKPSNPVTLTTAKWQTVVIHSGDSLSTLFKNNGLSAKEISSLSHTVGTKPLYHLKQGREIRFDKDANGQLQQLAYAMSDKSTLHLVRSGKTYKASIRAVPISSIAPLSVKLATIKKTAVTATPTLSAGSGLRYASGRISRSLMKDARKAGLSTKQVNQLVQIFSPKNLVQKVHVGDEFRVLYENPTTATGSKKSTGNVLAAQLVIKDKVYQQIRFTDPKGHTEYYTPQGQSLRDAILRVPPRFGRITSGFSSNRLDPALGFRRPHLGVDFAGHQGAPIQAASDGVLAEVGYKGGYGKVIVIRHDSKYSTLYAHLSKFASNMHEGQVVHKGETIGYVGQTGLATGPHLHYEIHVNGIAMNPMTVALPGASVPKAYRNHFLLQSKMLLAQLNTHKRQVQLAQRVESVKQS